MGTAAPVRGLSPLGLGLLTGGSMAGLSLALSLAMGWGAGSPLDLEFWRGPRGWFDAVLSGLFGWALGGSLALLRGAERDLQALRPALRENAELPDLDALPTRLWHKALGVGLLIGVAINCVPDNWPEGFPGLGDPFFLWATFRTCLVAAAVCGSGVIAVRLARSFSRLGEALRIDDLLDPEPLAPLGRAALRTVAVWAGISAFFALMLMAPFGRSVTAVSMALSAGLGLLAFVGPVRGSRCPLVGARDAELARARAALRARLDGKPLADGRWAELSLADLLAWEARLERVRTWPFDASTLVRFALYVTIGMGSWIGAALVERALGAALG